MVRVERIFIFVFLWLFHSTFFFCLSRYPPLTGTSLSDAPEVNALDLSSMGNLQRQDTRLAKIFVNLETFDKNTMNTYSLVDGILYKKSYDPQSAPLLLVLPQPYYSDILHSLHDDPSAGHLGFSRTLQRVRSRFFWPRMIRTVRQYVASCKDCKRRKKPPLVPAGHMQPIPPTEIPFQRLGIDLLGPFPKSRCGNRWIVVSVDYATTYVETKAIPDSSAEQIAMFLLQRIILRHGAPRELISDRGRNFLSAILASLLHACSVVHHTTTSYHPQTNGMTERINKTLVDMLYLYVDVEQTNWDEILPFSTFAYNTSLHSVTGFSPFYLLYARSPTTTLDTVLPYHDDLVPHDTMCDIFLRAEEARQLTRIHSLDSQDMQRSYYNQHRRDVHYCPGDLVWVFTPVRRKGRSEKLMRHYFGPYKITKKLSSVTYEVVPEPTCQ